MRKNVSKVSEKYHKFRRKVQRIGIRIYKLVSLSGVEEKVSYENEAISLTRKIIKMSDSELSMTPRTNKRFIINKRLDISIILKNHTIHIYDNKNPYPTQLSDKNYLYIINFFDDEVEKRREKLEKDIEQGVKNILISIFKKVQNYEEDSKNK